jgi:hypothetical protein
LYSPLIFLPVYVYFYYKSVFVANISECLPFSN